MAKKKQLNFNQSGLGRTVLAAQPGQAYFVNGRMIDML
jgi:hypothetical protein